MDCPKTDCNGKVSLDNNCCSECDEWFSPEYLEGYWDGYMAGRNAGENKIMDKMRDIF